MKLLMMFLLLHTVVITLAAPAGSNTAQRAPVAESSVIMYVIPHPWCVHILTGICFLGRRGLTRIHPLREVFMICWSLDAQVLNLRPTKDR
ncbi:hypothetical protein BD769DRAFT_1422931 [Suillus cothurnatus]|nr:hypothetical protein BD769DRAFT_1422931 [Suillus cothurnatus]